MDLIKLTLTEVRDAIAGKKVSSREVTEAVYKRIEETSDLNTFITLCRESALKAADLADARIARGEKLGALEGVPIVLKDNISLEGERLTCGSKFLDNYIAPFDATVAKKLKAAGHRRKGEYGRIRNGIE